MSLLFAAIIENKNMTLEIICPAACLSVIAITQMSACKTPEADESTDPAACFSLDRREQCGDRDEGAGYRQANVELLQNSTVSRKPNISSDQCSVETVSGCISFLGNL